MNLKSKNYRTMETKRKSNRQYFNCHIAGFSHWEGCLVINKLKPGAKLKLERDTHNPFDPHAVAIYYKDTKLGYIPKNQNEDISIFLDMGHSDLFDARVQSVCPYNHPESQVRIAIFIKHNN